MGSITCSITVREDGETITLVTPYISGACTLKIYGHAIIRVRVADGVWTSYGTESKKVRYAIQSGELDRERELAGERCARSYYAETVDNTFNGTLDLTSLVTTRTILEIEITAVTNVTAELTAAKHHSLGVDEVHHNVLTLDGAVITKSVGKDGSELVRTLNGENITAVAIDIEAQLYQLSSSSEASLTATLSVILVNEDGDEYNFSTVRCR
jgi:hypothetical protein